MYMGTIILVSEYYVSNRAKLGKCTKYPEQIFICTYSWLPLKYWTFFKKSACCREYLLNREIILLTPLAYITYGRIPIMQRLLIGNPDRWALEEGVSKTGSSTIHNFWCTYWFCDFILGYVDHTENIRLLLWLQKVQGLVNKRLRASGNT